MLHDYLVVVVVVVVREETLLCYLRTRLQVGVVEDSADEEMRHEVKLI